VTATPAGPPPNNRRSEQVITIAKRIMHSQGIQIGWMNAETAQALQALFGGGQTLIKMQLLREGVDRETAEQRAEATIPLAAFELGLLVGAELESTRAFREIVGDENFDFGEGES
jgi:hypothetical protein